MLRRGPAQIIDGHEVRGNLEAVPMATLRTVLREAFAKFDAGGRRSTVREEFPLAQGPLVVVVYPEAREKHPNGRRFSPYAMVSVQPLPKKK